MSSAAAGVDGVASSAAASSIAAQWSTPTSVLYASDVPVFEGPYAASRAKLDYSWHSHYTPARQRVQDGIIACMLNSGLAVEQPWLVHTAGAMGAGKSHAMRWLTRAGAFPLNAFVWVDPDRIKSALPDTAGFVAHNRAAAGTLTHAESVLIAELVEREALSRNKCVLVDGSLRNEGWYRGKFARARVEWPAYRIAIILVTASRDAVYARAARRALTTGRVVPQEVLDDALLRVPASFAALQPLADYTCVLANDGGEWGEGAGGGSRASEGSSGGGGEWGGSRASFRDGGTEVVFQPPATMDSFRERFRSVAQALEGAVHRGASPLQPPCGVARGEGAAGAPYSCFAEHCATRAGE